MFSPICAYGTRQHKGLAVCTQQVLESVFKFILTKELMRTEVIKGTVLVLPGLGAMCGPALSV
jgi:hypothetical protein